jgi:hypothetical protein
VPRRAAVARGTSAACGAYLVTALWLPIRNWPADQGPATYRGMAEPWLRRDYTHLWRLPPPLPPARWPGTLLVLVVGAILCALVAGL